MYKSALLTTLLFATVACDSKKPADNEPPTPPAVEQEATETTTPPVATPPATTESPAEPVAAGEPEPLAIASNALAFDLYKTIRASDGNLAFSPASISLAFAMTYAGANTATAAEMKQVLHLPADEELQSSAAGLLQSWNAEQVGYELKVVNRLFGDANYTFAQSFIDVTKSVYQAPLESLNFRGEPETQRLHINKWVNEQTEERITDLLPPKSIDGNTRLVLANAVYFLGQWASAFDAKQTKNSQFLVNGTEKVDVPMMRQTETFAFSKQEGVKLLRMGYAKSALAMTIVLPDDDNGLGKLEESITSETYKQWSDALPNSRYRKIRLSLPSFEIADAKLPLKESLQTLGMQLAFDASKADFTRMANPAKTADQLYITKAFHQAFVKVDEKGTEAAAATAVVMGSKGAGKPTEPMDFTVDHPFLFIIEDTNTGAILFLGRVVDPR